MGNLKQDMKRIRSGLMGASDDLDKRAEEIEKNLKKAPLPEKIEIANFPVWESVYKSYRSEQGVLLPNRESGIDFFNSKVLNIPVKYLAAGLLVFKILKK